jgi:hypothetical protein
MGDSVADIVHRVDRLGSVEMKVGSIDIRIGRVEAKLDYLIDLMKPKAPKR